MLEPGDLVNNCRYLLKAVEDAAVSLSVVLPDRRYVTMGGSVFDCEQVTVSAMNSNTGVVSPDTGALNVIGACSPVWNAQYEASIVLAAHEATQGPRGTILPKVDVVESDAEAISEAYAVLINAVDAVSSSDDVGRLTCTVAFGQPQGGFLAVVATITMNLWL